MGGLPPGRKGQWGGDKRGVVEPWGADYYYVMEGDNFESRGKGTRGREEKFENEVVIGGLRDIQPEWILENKMHHGSENSRFFAIATGKYHPHRLRAVEAKVGGRVVAAAIFEEYPDTSPYWGSFSKNRQHYLMRGRGRVGLYTLPEFRGRGIARKMAARFIEEMLKEKTSGAINLVAHQFTISNFFRELNSHRGWASTPTPIGRNIWESQLKKQWGYRPEPEPVSKSTAIEVLVQKGWRVKPEVDGKFSLEDNSEHEEWGELRRVEFFKRVPAWHSALRHEVGERNAPPCKVGLPRGGGGKGEQLSPRRGLGLGG